MVAVTTAVAGTPSPCGAAWLTLGAVGPVVTVAMLMSST